MIDVHLIIDFFDGTLSHLWGEVAIEAHLDELVTLDDPIEGGIVIGEVEIVDVVASVVLRLCFQCCGDLLVPSGAYHYGYESENVSAYLQTSDDGATITVSGVGPSQAMPAHELMPALYACGVRYIELLERLERRGRPSYDLPSLREAAATARDLLVRRGWL